MFSVKGLLAVLVMALLVSIPISYYWGFLTRGMRPSGASLQLNELEKNGVPDFTLPGLDGKDVSLSQFAGKPVLINLWASWCAPCVKEFPSLQRLVEKFKGQVIVLAVSHDRTRDDLESFIKAFGAPPKDFIIVWDKERVTAKILGTDQLPETYILNRDHKLVRKIAGEQVWDDPGAMDYFKQTLGL